MTFMVVNFSFTPVVLKIGTHFNINFPHLSDIQSVNGIHYDCDLGFINLSLRLPKE
jgi:hypothetical protein